MERIQDWGILVHRSLPAYLSHMLHSNIFLKGCLMVIKIQVMLNKWYMINGTLFNWFPIHLWHIQEVADTSQRRHPQNYCSGDGTSAWDLLWFCDSQPTSVSDSAVRWTPNTLVVSFDTFHAEIIRLSSLKLGGSYVLSIKKFTGCRYHFKMMITLPNWTLHRCIMMI